MESPREVRIEVERPRCPYCHEQVELGVRKVGCDDCLAWHHGECWEEHGGCSACGRAQAAIPLTRERGCSQRGCVEAALPGQDMCASHARREGLIALPVAAIALLVGLALASSSGGPPGATRLGVFILVVGIVLLLAGARRIRRARGPRPRPRPRPPGPDKG